MGKWPVSEHLGTVRLPKTLAYQLLPRHTDFRGVMLVRLRAIIWQRDAAPFGFRGRAGPFW